MQSEYRVKDYPSVYVRQCVSVKCAPLSGVNTQNDCLTVRTQILKIPAFIIYTVWPSRWSWILPAPLPPLLPTTSWSQLSSGSKSASFSPLPPPASRLVSAPWLKRTNYPIEWEDLWGSPNPLSRQYLRHRLHSDPPTPPKPHSTLVCSLWTLCSLLPSLYPLIPPNSFTTYKTNTQTKLNWYRA